MTHPRTDEAARTDHDDGHERRTDGAPSDTTRIERLEVQLRDLERRVENHRLVRDTWTIIVLAVAAITLVASVVAVGIAMRAVDDGDESSAPVAGAIVDSPDGPL